MRRRVYGLFVGMIGMVGTVCAQSVAIYQVTDMAGQSEHQILNKEEAAKLTAELKEEAKVFPAILAAARKEWDANRQENKIPFPTAKIKPRAMKKVGSDFPNKEAAMKRLTQIEERIADKIAKEAKEKRSARNKKRSNPEDVAKETLKQTLINNAILDVNRRVAEKVGRDIPFFGFMVASEKKDVKKEPPKDVKKGDEKKEAGKKPAR